MAENNFSLQKTLTMLLDEKKYHSLRDILSTMNPADIAAIFDDLDQACLPLLFRDALACRYGTPSRISVDPDCAEDLSHRLTREQLAALIDTVEDLQHARVYNMNEALFLTLMCSRLRQAAGK